MNIYARAALMGAVLSFTTPALADNCHLTQLASVDMLPTSDNNVVVVPVSVNSQQVQFLLDTGGGVSNVAEKAVQAFKLTRREAALRLLDMDGNASQQFVRLDSMELGRLKAKDINLMIWPDRDLPFDGLIAGDILSHYDVELNFVTRKLNLFSQDHCDGRVIYWPATVRTTVPFSMKRPLRDTIDVEIGHDTHIRVPVTLDGKQFQAIVDTGASFTMISASVAESAFGITAASPGAERLDDQGFSYAFHNLAFGGITITNPHIAVLPDLVGTNDRDNTAVTGSMIVRRDGGMDTDLLIGMNVLTHLHIYIAYGEQKLYVTPPDQPAAPAAGR